MLNVGLTRNSGGNSSLYALSFIFSKILYGPAARGINLDFLNSGGPITRSRARQLNLQVSSFLCTYSCAFENSVLPNELIVLRNEGKDQQGHGEGLGGMEGQQGRSDQGGGPNRRP